MKNHELLKYAYDNYPKGCVAKLKGSDVEHTSDGKFQIQQSIGNGIVVLSGDGMECFFAEKSSSGKEQWAEIVTHIKPILISEDGVELFDGDEAHHVYKDRIDGYKYNGTFKPWLANHNFVFSTKKAALDWIEKANKPKEIEVPLFNKGFVAIVTRESILIKDLSDNYKIKFLKPSDIEDISHSLNQLK